MDKDSEFSTATLSCLMTMCLPIETGCSKLVEELRIASFKIAKNTDSWQIFQERLQTVHLLLLLVSLGIFLEEQQDHLMLRLVISDHLGLTTKSKLQLNYRSPHLKGS